MSETWEHIGNYSGVIMRYHRGADLGITLKFTLGSLVERMFITDTELIREGNEGLTFERLFEVFCPEVFR